MKKYVYLPFFVLFFLNLSFASPYTTWLTGFQMKLNTGTQINDAEKEALEDEFQLKPEGIASDYNIWINMLKRNLIVGPSLSKTEKQILNYIIMAKPENNASRYLTFIQVLDKQIRKVGPVLDSTEKEILKILLKARTEKAPSPDQETFQIEWQKRYQQLQNLFGNLNSTEKLLLDYFKKTIPEKRLMKKDDPVYQKIRSLFLHSPSLIAGSIAKNNYELGSRMVEIIETFYTRLKIDVEKNNDPDLNDLLDRISQLN